MWTNLKQAIDSVIKTNDSQEITGAILNNTLKTIVDTVGANAAFAGIATPSTNPGTPDGPVFYIASEEGIYSNFGSIEIASETLTILMWDGNIWQHATVNIDSNFPNFICTDNETLNGIIPYIIATSDVKKIRVSVGNTNNINIAAMDANGNDLYTKYYADALSAPEMIDVHDVSSTTVSNMLVVFNKSFFMRKVQSLTGVYESFIGNLQNVAYDQQAMTPIFGKYKQTKDWGTMSGTMVETGIGVNIYGTVDCFRFPAKVVKIKIPAKKDGVVEIYRTRLLDAVGTETVLLATINVKTGTHSYPVDIDFAAGEGFGLCGAGIVTARSTNVSWRLNNYSVSTLQRGSDSPVSGFVNGAMNCEIEYYYFAQKTPSPLKGVKISVLGDSISTFGTDYSYSNPYYPSADIYNAYQTWWGRLQQDGAVILKNMSVSQSTFINRTGDNEHRWVGYDARITNLNGDNNEVPDVILVLCGINDLFTNANLGDFDFTKKITDFSELNTFSFKQALQYVVMRLIELYPSSKIMLGTPFKVGNSDWNFPEQNGVRYLYQICDAIREIARVMGVGLIDFYSEVQISYAEMKDLKYGNNIHPNRLGHYLYYQIVKRHLLDMNYQNTY